MILLAFIKRANYKGSKQSMICKKGKKPTQRNKELAGHMLLIPGLGKQRQVDLVGSRPAWFTQSSRTASIT